MKPQPEVRSHQSLSLGIEIYGAPLLNSWLNKDLGIAGRVFYLNKQNVCIEKLVRLEKYPVVIPQLAIHLDRDVNEKGLVLNKQDHLNALAGFDIDFPDKRSYIETLLKESLDYNRLISFDLHLFPLDPARLVGYKHPFIASYRIDSLASVHAALSAFLENLTPLEEDIKMIIFWDNEEVGSHTAQGAKSPFLNHTLERILLSLGQSREDYFKLLNRSHCTSIDLAHALHPNHSDKHDPQHRPLLGKGVVLKTNAQQRYATDANSSLPIEIAALKAGIPLQKFASRNDIPCGTTIGPLQACATGMPTVDIGCGQLSMHGCRELMSVEDHHSLYKLLQTVLEMPDWPQL